MGPRMLAPLLLLPLLPLLLGGARAATVTIDWSLQAAYPVSVYVRVGDTVVFGAPLDDAGVVSSVVAVVSAGDRTPDPQPGAFSVTFVATAGTAAVAVDSAMVGRNYIIVDTRLGHERKLGQVVVRARSDRQLSLSGPRTVDALSAHVEVGDQVVWECPSCALVDRAWIAETDRAGNVLPKAGSPFELGPPGRALVFALRFNAPGIFFYVSPLMPDVRGVITVGVPPNPADRLPQLNVPLHCVCMWPDAPCPGTPLPPAVPPPPPATPPALPPDPLVVCASCTAPIEGISGPVVFVDPVYGSDCAGTSGSASQPFRSMGSAVCAASANTTVLVRFEGVFYEDMLTWSACAQCVQWLLEDRQDSSELATATLRSGGLVFLRKTSPQWERGATIDVRWLNSHRFAKLVNRTLVPEIV